VLLRKDLADYRRYLREFNAKVTLDEFYDLFWRRRLDTKLKVPRALEVSFEHPTTDVERRIKALIDEHSAGQRVKFEQELFAQRKRLADAERSLQVKPTKTAAQSKRVASEKVDWLLGKLAELRQTEPKEDDYRIFPGYYSPVIVMENGERAVKLMRYQCRPAGKPVSHDGKYPGTYNARRDSLGGFWKDLFGYHHGVLVVSAFYENVSRPSDTRESSENVVLEFRPRPQRDMLVARLWSKWTAPGQPDLLSFAAITDDPPPEVAAAGHDRCIVSLRPENIDAWLRPNKDLQAMQSILDDRPSAYYDHRLAA
jgi:putative SOS response-associated peptidase YedK